MPSARLSLWLLLALGGAVPGAAQEPSLEAPLAVGRPAPALALGSMLDGQPTVVPGHERALVLVFWATWCGSCLAEFPRLNGLVRELENEPLDFVAVCDEPREKVEALLASRPLQARVALDDEGRTFEAFGVRVLPRIVLVDGAGRVAALPRLEDLDGDVLRALAAGEALALPTARSTPADLEWDEGRAGLDAARSLGHVWLEPSDAASGGVRFPPAHGRITADGVGFANLVQIAWDARPHQVLSTHPAYLDFEHVYRLSVKAPDDRPETARAMLREHLARLFSFHAEWAQREESTPVLRRRPGRELVHLQPSSAAKSDGMACNGSIRYVRVPFQNIASALGTFGLGRGLVDETGLTGLYDLDLSWTPGDAHSFTDALESTGLECVEEPRTVSKLLLGPAR